MSLEVSMKKIVLILSLIMFVQLSYAESNDPRDANWTQLDSLREILSRHDVTIGSIKFLRHIVLTFERDKQFPDILRASAFEIVAEGERRFLGYLPENVVLTLNETEGKWRAGMTFRFTDPLGIGSRMLAIELQGLIALGEIFSEKAFVSYVVTEGVLGARKEIIDPAARCLLRKIDSQNPTAFTPHGMLFRVTRHVSESIGRLDGATKDILIGNLADHLASRLYEKLLGEINKFKTEELRTFLVEHVGEANLDVEKIKTERLTEYVSKIQERWSVLDLQVHLRTLLREVIRCKK